MPDNNTGKVVGTGAGAIVGGGIGASVGGAVGTWVQKRLGKTDIKDAKVMYSYSQNPKYRFEQSTGRWIISGQEAGQLYSAASGESADFWTDHGVETGRMNYKGVIITNGVAYDANRFGEDARGSSAQYQGRTWQDVKAAGKTVSDKLGNLASGLIGNGDTTAVGGSGKWIIYAVIAFVALKVLK